MYNSDTHEIESVYLDGQPIIRRVTAADRLSKALAEVEANRIEARKQGIADPKLDWRLLLGLNRPI